MNSPFCIGREADSADLKARIGVRPAGGCATVCRTPYEICKAMTARRTQTVKTMVPSVADDPRWALIVARDKTADGQLWYSVSTTGVYLISSSVPPARYCDGVMPSMPVDFS